MKSQKRAKSADVLEFYATHLLFVCVLLTFVFFNIEYNIQTFKNGGQNLFIVYKTDVWSAYFIDNNG